MAAIAASFTGPTGYAIGLTGLAATGLTHHLGRNDHDSFASKATTSMLWLSLVFMAAPTVTALFGINAALI